MVLVPLYHLSIQQLASRFEEALGLLVVILTTKARYMPKDTHPSVITIPAVCDTFLAPTLLYPSLPTYFIYPIYSRQCGSKCGEQPLTPI